MQVHTLQKHPQINKNIHTLQKHSHTIQKKKTRTLQKHPHIK
jgi:hypothetical protein